MSGYVEKAAVLRIIFDSVGKPATEIYQKVREVPEADAGTVVRYRSCANWQTDWEPASAPNRRFCGMVDLLTAPDFYCGYAERRKPDG
jgi:hypothetical protein